MLRAAGHESGADDLHRVAVLVETLGDDVLPALGVDIHPGMDRQPSGPSCSSSSGTPAPD
jgi:hypothetical protein